MGENEVKAMEGLARALAEIDQNKLWIIAIVIIIAIVSFVVRWYFLWTGQQQFQNNIKNLTMTIRNVADILSEHNLDSIKKLQSLSSIMSEIRDRQKHIINKSDSIRIILNKFNDVVKREVITVFEWSIINNDYENRKEFVRKKVKTALADIIATTHKSLTEFNLSIKLDQFFVTYTNEKDGNIHFKLVDLLWDDVEAVYNKSRYKNKRIEEQQLEEMQILVNNVIAAELTKIQVEINDIYKNDR